MTGWRIGYVAGDNKIIKAMNSLQSHSTSGPNSIAQKASIEALLGPQEPLEEMRQEFDERRKLMVNALNDIPGISCRIPKGAFYAFPDISSFIGKSFKGEKINTDSDFARLLWKIIMWWQCGLILRSTRIFTFFLCHISRSYPGRYETLKGICFGNRIIIKRGLGPLFSGMIFGDTS